MARIALINAANEIVRTEREERIDQTAGVRTGHRWVPVVQETVDTSTPGNEFTVTTRAAPVVEASRVLVTTTIRDMTAQEASSAKDGRVSQVVRDPAFKALATAVFELVNDVRTLKGQGTITAAQFRAYLKSKL